MKSIAEIEALEKAHELGAPSLGVAADALLERWMYGIRDNETFIRLAFLSWYSHSEPTWYNGLHDSLPNVDALVADLGGIDQTSAESKFILAALATGYPWCLGNEKYWSNLSTLLPEEAKKIEPTSALFADWRFILGHQEERSMLKNKLASEFHARFHGRGYMGVYLESVFGRRVGL